MPHPHAAGSAFRKSIEDQCPSALALEPPLRQRSPTGITLELYGIHFSIIPKIGTDTVLDRERFSFDSVYMYCQVRGKTHAWSRVRGKVLGGRVFGIWDQIYGDPTDPDDAEWLKDSSAAVSIEEGLQPGAASREAQR